MDFQLNSISLLSSTSLFFVVLLWVVVFYLYDFHIERLYEVKLTAECLLCDTGEGVTDTIPGVTC